MHLVNQKKIFHRIASDCESHYYFNKYSLNRSLKIPLLVTVVLIMITHDDMQAINLQKSHRKVTIKTFTKMYI